MQLGRILALAVLLAPVVTGRSSPVDGLGTEAPTTVVGWVTDHRGAPAAGAEVTTALGGSPGATAASSSPSTCRSTWSACTSSSSARTRRRTWRCRRRPSA